MVERIYPPKDFESLINKLVEEGPFETKQKVMMFAAATGYYLRKRKPRGKAADGIRWDIFERSNDDVFIHALALAESGSIEILGRDRQENEDDSLKIFEEYAAAGLEYLENNCVNRPGNILDNLLNFVADAEREKNAEAEGKPDLERLVDQLGF